MANDKHLERLTESARVALELTDDERIEKIQKQVWIPYPQAKRVLEELETLINTPKRDRMPNMVIVGSTNNGKSTILRRFAERYPMHVTARSTVMPIVYIQAPISAGHNALYEKILDAVMAPYGINDTSSRKENQAINMLRDLGTKLLIIDEFQDIFHAGRDRQQKFLAAVKHLGNELRIPIVAVGVEQVIQVISADPQMANRFEPIFLKRWQLDDDFRRLLMSIESTLPLMNPSQLHAHQTAALLYRMSEGVLGELMTIIQRAGVQAIKSKKELIDEAVLKSIRYTRPSDRRIEAKGL